VAETVGSKGTRHDKEGNTKQRAERKAEGSEELRVKDNGP
jgi:hypothetical protein